MTVGSILLSFVLAMVVGISGVIAPGGGAALGASTSLTILSGEVQVSHAGGPFAPAADGAVLGPGDVIRTAADARAVLTYFEGSTVAIEPSSELAIQEAGASPDGSTVVVMTQNLGRTWHVVTKLITGGSRYEVRTPAATASVRGTAFEVGVVRDASGANRTDIVTTEGAVAAAAPATAADPQPEPVLVPAGFQTTTRSTERKPAPPALVPAPERSVTVTVGSSNSLVVDPLGRANGMKDGKLVIQTPGATVTTLAGTLQITLPNVPDGKLATFVERGGGRGDFDVPVITTVQDRGRPSTLVRDTVEAGARMSGLEVKKSDAEGAAPSLRRIESEAERNDLKAPKARVEGPALPGRTTVLRPGLGGDPQVIARIAEERRAAAPRAADGGQRPGSREDKESTDRQGGFVPTLPFQAAPAAERQMDERDAEKESKATEQLQRATSEAQKAVGDAQARLLLQQQQAAAAERRAAEQAAQAERRRIELQQQQQSAERERLLELERERERVLKAEAAKAAQEALERDKKAKELAETQRRLKELEEKLKQQQQQRGGGGSSGGGSGGSGNNNGGGNNRNR